MPPIIVGETSGRDIRCEHAQHVPAFDAEACRYLSPEQVRGQYPRYQGVCTACHARIILYASLEHFFAGGW